MKAVERHGQLVLLVVFLSLLGGRFTLSRAGLQSDLDLRLLGAYGVLLAYLLWAHVAARHTAKTPVGFYGFWVAAFCTWMAISAGWAPEGARTGDSLTDLALMALFVLLGLQVASRVPDTGIVWRWTWLAGLVYFFAAVLAGPGGQGRYAALGGGPNVFVRVMILAAIAALALAVLRDDLVTLWTMPMFAIGVVLSGSRGGLVTFAVVALVGAYPIIRGLRRRTRRRLLAVTALAAVPAGWLLAPQLSAIWQSRFVGETFGDRHLASRDTLVANAWSMYLENPISGAGLDGFHATYPDWPYPHNLLLGAAAEGGTIAAILLLAALATVPIASVRSRPISAEASYFLLGGLAILVASMFSGDLYDTRFMWLFFGLAAIETQRQKETDSPGRETSSGLGRSTPDSLASPPESTVH